MCDQTLAHRPGTAHCCLHVYSVLLGAHRIKTKYLEAMQPVLAYRLYLLWAHCEGHVPARPFVFVSAMLQRRTSQRV